MGMSAHGFECTDTQVSTPQGPHIYGRNRGKPKTRHTSYKGARDAAKTARHLDAEERAQERADRTPQQQLDYLDRRLGKGLGAVRERAKLAALIKAPKPKGKKQDEVQPDTGEKPKFKKGKKRDKK